MLLKNKSFLLKGPYIFREPQKSPFILFYFIKTLRLTAKSIFRLYSQPFIILTILPFKVEKASSPITSFYRPTPRQIESATSLAAITPDHPVTLWRNSILGST